MIILLLLFSFSSWAEDMSSEKYCFSSELQGLTARQKFKAIEVASDVVTQDAKCLIIQMRPHRRETIQRYLQSSMPGMHIAFSSEDVRKEPCSLKVEKEKTKTAQELQAGHNRYPTLNASTTNSSGNEVMQIQTLREFELTVDQDQIKGVCRFLNSNRYEISLEVRKNPKPLIPTELPPGTVVVVNQPPADQETMVLQTQLQISRGERIEIGSIVKNLKDQNKNLDINPSIGIGASGQKSVEKVFLSIQ